jgi:hypothetical protein
MRIEKKGFQQALVVFLKEMFGLSIPWVYFLCLH